MKDYQKLLCGVVGKDDIKDVTDGDIESIRFMDTEKCFGTNDIPQHIKEALLKERDRRAKKNYMKMTFDKNIEVIYAVDAFALDAAVNTVVYYDDDDTPPDAVMVERCICAGVNPRHTMMIQRILNNMRAKLFLHLMPHELEITPSKIVAWLPVDEMIKLVPRWRRFIHTPLYPSDLIFVRINIWGRENRRKKYPFVSSKKYVMQIKEPFPCCANCASSYTECIWIPRNHQSEISRKPHFKCKNCHPSRASIERLIKKYFHI